MYSEHSHTEEMLLQPQSKGGIEIIGCDELIN